MWAFARKFVDQDFKNHLNIGLAIRLLLIMYSSYHDANFEVSYTDIDYKVFSDAAKHVYDGESPYKRHIYRLYSPIIAYLITPTIIFGSHTGQLLFTSFDIFIAIAIKRLVECQTNLKKSSDMISTYCALFWLYNPMSIAISTRGNADSIPCFFVILSIYFLQTDAVKSLWKYILSGFFLGVAIHFQFYPFAFSIAMFYSLGEYKLYRYFSLIPNKKQVCLTASFFLTLTFLCSIMYSVYGEEFFSETYLYHLSRKNTKHNFSILFYHSYLTMNQLAFDVVKSMLIFFKIILIFFVSLTFGAKFETLPFALFCQLFIVLTYNNVITSEYFIWILSLLPVVVHSFKMQAAKALRLITLWLVSQGVWLFFVYLLEFKSKEVFPLIWWANVLFFCTNMYILVQLIKAYTPGYGFGKAEDMRQASTVC